MHDTLLDAPVADAAPVETPETETSVAAHAEQFGPSASPAPVSAEPSPEPVERPRERHRATSQQAAPDEVQQINALTRDLRTKEAELAKIRPDALSGSPRLRVLQRQIKAIEAELREHQQPTPEPTRREPARPAPRESSDATGFTEPEPKLEDFTQHDDPYSAWQRALGRWDRAKERFEEQQQFAQTVAQRQQQERTHQLLAGYAQRETAFKASTPDWAQVMQTSPVATDELTPTLERAILEDDNGPQIAYYLAQHPDVFDSIMLDTLDKDATDRSVAILRRRLTSELNRQQAVSTGSAATYRPAPLAPRPPNPVRTGATKTGDEPPGDGHSLAEHAKHFGPKRR